MAYNTQLLLKEVDARFSANPAFTLVELAGELRIHRQTLEKAVRGAKGLTFREYRRQARLEKAIQLLTQSPILNRKEISYRIGFKSATAFSRFVKAMTGKTPSQIKDERVFGKNRHFRITIRHFVSL